MKTKKDKQSEALARQENHDKLSITKKIKKAQNRRGESKKEIARLQTKENS